MTLHRTLIYSTPMSLRPRRSTPSSSPRPKRRSKPRKAVDADRAAGKPLGKMGGVPIGMKDLFATEGVQTTAASHILEGFVPNMKHRFAKLWERGRGMLGKLNLDQFAMGSSNETSYFGNVISPWRRNDGGNAALAPGGSSGGSARRRLRRGCARRRPAPTPAARSASPRLHRHFRHQADLWPLLALGHCRLRQLARSGGPMARDVRDCAIMLEAMAGFDPKDSTSLDLPVPEWEAGLSPTCAARRSAFPRIPPGRHRRRYRRSGTGHRLAEGCGRGDRRDQPAAHQICAAGLLHHRPAEASSNLARYDGVRYGLRDLPDGAGCRTCTPPPAPPASAQRSSAAS
jgi:aspartyl-tRNA(Asn)/glutamyl-tRNA(Gln) amidotransferase subunit A